ncbi:DNA polymerase III subunit chi [Candidatus Arcanobacter lacustris]|uniref:DNA polymerase III subunit chi n=1 Tax=Candidatus Arcanibacter lacustris TaxID=1607817 RepID=A0A0F5MRN5_9RICK|nr:DNA polymerase III subunit chi [Candidatus Arcanobacter lacustris]
MTEVIFYHLSASTMEKAAPRLLEKIVEADNRAILYLENDEQISKYNDLLWTFGSRSFLAHGCDKDPFPHLQPIFLTKDQSNPNNANIVITLSGIEIPHINDFAKSIDIFDGNDNEQLEAARARYKKYKQNGFSLTYWKQDEAGSWQKG